VDLGQLWNKLRTLASALSRTQLITLGVTFVAVVALVGGATYWIQAPSYRLLFSDLDAEAAAAVVSRLKEQNVPYRLDDGGRSVRVAEERLDELRLDFAGNGLPTSGRIGFEIFDRTSFGATDFLEQVNYRRALEGEIARTISSLAEVAEARVHIAMAKDSLFVSDKQQAKASVVLKLRQRKPLAPTTARAIATLVAASVEGLDAESVVILDNSGRSLGLPPRNEDQDAEMVAEGQRLERDLTTRLVAMLEPVVGVGGVRVNVSAELSRTSEEETSEVYDPNPVVRSRNISGVSEATLAGTGVAGARSNIPGVNPAVPATASSLGGGRGSETTNYELSKTIKRSVTPGGELARLSVAVVLDDERVATTGKDGTTTYSSKRRDPAEIQKIQNLVAAAVGFNTERGDQLTVENISFEEVTAVEQQTTAPVPAWQQYVPMAAPYVRPLLVVVLALIALFFVIRPALRAAFPQPEIQLAHAVLPAELPRSVKELEEELEAKLETVESGRTFRVRGSTEVSRRINAIAKGDPEDTARLLRSWLVDDPR
jgi:flagellar M-ring protein FliF